MANSLAAFPTDIQMPVEVIGCDLSGQQFFETTKTITISRNEVSILLSSKLAADTEVILRNPENNEEAIAIVVGRLHEKGNGHVYGLVFQDPAVNLWHIKFPADAEARMVQLACSGCHEVSAQSLTESEVNLLDITREVRRPCQKCNSLTIWKDPTREAAPKKPADQPTENQIQFSDAPPKEERRKNRRTAMKMTACVRHSGLEEIVNCEDVSKGGFRFTCRKKFPVGTRVEVAVPYARSATNIFSSAVIKYCLPIPGGEFRYGLAHVKNSSSDAWDS
jgi:hypothetical protein